MDRLRYRLQSASISDVKTGLKLRHERFRVDRKNLLLNYSIDGSRTKPVGWSRHWDVKNGCDLLSGGGVLAEKAHRCSARSLRWVFPQEPTSLTETAESAMCFQRENTCTGIKLGITHWKTCWQNLGWAGLLKFIRKSWGKQNAGYRERWLSVCGISWEVLKTLIPGSS